MVISYKLCHIHVAIIVAVFSVVEFAAIVVVFATGVKHPLMRCQTLGSNFIDRTYVQNLKLDEKPVCTTNGTLLVWIGLHLLTNVAVMISLYKKSTQLLFPHLIATFMDLLTTSAYLVVLLVFLVVGETVDEILIIFIIGLVVFKFLSFICLRKLYWYLKWRKENEMLPRSALVKDENTFQF